MPYPQKLQALVQLFEKLSERERRETLITYAEKSEKYQPRKNACCTIEDVRKDERCLDTVGIYLYVDKQGRCVFRVMLGEKVQTLTKALATILCEGLEGSTLQEILDLPRAFIPRIVGAELVRLRSQTIYYVLERMQEAVGKYLEKRNQGGGE